MFAEYNRPMRKFLLFAAIAAAAVLGYLFIYVPLQKTALDESAPDKNAAAAAGVGAEQEKIGKVVGTTGHPASGSARIASAGGKNYVRFEDFKTINGPDLYVYLANGLDAKDFVSLGKIKATEGNINYEIPAGVNPADYKYVLIWCKAFSVLFNYAEIS